MAAGFDQGMKELAQDIKIEYQKELGTVMKLQAPEGNITGVTYHLPVDSQFEIFQAIVPELKALFLLLGKGDPSAVVDQAAT